MPMNVKQTSLLGISTFPVRQDYGLSRRKESILGLCGPRNTHTIWPGAEPTVELLSRSSDKHLPDKVEYPWLGSVGASENSGKARRSHPSVRFQTLLRQTCV